MNHTENPVECFGRNRWFRFGSAKVTGSRQTAWIKICSGRKGKSAPIILRGQPEILIPIVEAILSELKGLTDYRPHRVRVITGAYQEGLCWGRFHTAAERDAYIQGLKDADDGWLTCRWEIPDEQGRVAPLEDPVVRGLMSRGYAETEILGKEG